MTSRAVPWVASWLVLACFGLPPALAQTTAMPATRAVVAIFMTFCAPNTGRPDALRDAAEKAGAHRLQPQAEAYLLQDRPGQVFDFSALGWHFALASQDDGFCSAFAERADMQSLFPTVEAAMAESHQPFSIARTDPDPREPGLLTRTYHLTRTDSDTPEATYAISFDTAPGAVMQVLMTAGLWHRPKPAPAE